MAGKLPLAKARKENSEEYRHCATRSVPAAISVAPALVQSSVRMALNRETCVCVCVRVSILKMIYMPTAFTFRGSRSYCVLVKMLRLFTKGASSGTNRRQRLIHVNAVTVMRRPNKAKTKMLLICHENVTI